MLEIDDRQYKYEHGPVVTENATWPGTDSSGRVRVNFEDASGINSSFSINGEWALFRLLDRSRITKKGRDRFNIRIKSQHRTAEYEIIADSVVNPFDTDVLGEFSCFENLSQ
jgi:type VI secretion system protein ImpL